MNDPDAVAVIAAAWTIREALKAIVADRAAQRRARQTEAAKETTQP